MMESPIIVKDMNHPTCTSEMPISVKYSVKTWFVRPKLTMRTNTENQSSRMSAEDWRSEWKMCVDMVCVWPIVLPTVLSGSAFFCPPSVLSCLVSSVDGKRRFSFSSFFLTKKKNI